jgi:phenylalanyl-tRNA synthetase alpha chain
MTDLSPEHASTLARLKAQVAAATAVEDLRAIARAALEKGGVVADLLASIPTLPPAERKGAGQAANRIKSELEAAIEARKRDLEDAALSASRRVEGFDPTLRAPRVDRGALHPITQVVRELEDLFTSMGFEVLDGPEIELDWYNFEALNIPRDHPARDMQDTFRCDPAGELVLRTHTSPVQVRAMEKRKPPIRAIAPGKVFRQETTDASHEHTFHQMEGLVVDEDVSVGHLIHAMKTLLRGVFGKDIEVRLRPGYFPFVEPGFELDARCPFCKSGCSVCKQSTWIELLPCGMVHENVLRAGGIDPARYSGFAFGLGLSRLVMLRYGIDDVRHLLSGDTRFLRQFQRIG